MKKDKKLKAFHIIADWDSERVSFEVEKYLDSGWQLHGGLAVVVDHESPFYVQAVYTDDFDKHDLNNNK